MKKLLLIIICFNFQCVIAQTSYSEEVDKQIKLVENHLAGEVKIEGAQDYNILDRMAYYNVKGLSVAVIQNHKIVWAKGYGWADEEEKRPVTTTTLFQAASISKSFNALGVLKLVQEKKLDLNTDINTYLKSWKFPYDSLSGNKIITLKHLLSHSAGLSVHGFPGYNREAKIPSTTEILDGKAPANSPPVRSQFEPGLKFQYSGGGTTISQLLLSDVTQMPYDKFMANNVLQQLDMQNSFYALPPSADKLNLLATGYHTEGSMVNNKFHLYPEMGAAGLWTTPTDVCKYIIETQLAFEGKSAKILNQEMTKLRLTPYNDQHSALGVFVEDRSGVKYFQHGARNEGFSGMYYGSVEGGNGVVVFVNSDQGDIMYELINSVATVYNWKGYYEPIVKKEIKVADTITQKYSGIYVNENIFINIIKREDGYYLFGEGIYMKMHFSNETDFFNIESTSEKYFINDASGNINALKIIWEGQELPLFVKVKNVDTLIVREDFYNSIGWTLLENKKYDEAIKYLKRGLVLHPNNLFMEGNLAHCFLFSNNYEQAIKIYQQHNLKEIINNEFTWGEMIKMDLKYFKDKKFDLILIDKVSK